MYVTIIANPDNTSGEQIDTMDWLESLYSGIPLTPAQQTCENSKNFYKTRTFVPEDIQVFLDRHYTHAYRFTTQRTIDRLHHTVELFRLDHPGPMEDMYETFYIPKTSGGQRRIDAPKEHLKALMQEVKRTLENELRTQYHNNCYSYFKGRGVKDALIVHQTHKSKWFAKFDMKNFFPHTTKEFLLAQLCKLYPFAPLSEDYQDKLADIIDFCMYEEGLPQGTPMSPMLTNLMMIPIDYKLTDLFYKRGMRYTRYADDILVSSRRDFDIQEISVMITSVLNEEDAPFQLNNAKTRYGSVAGSNWNLGLMLNKDNEITVGHKRKQVIKATINNFLRDFTDNSIWSTIDVQRMMGELSYLKNVEPDYAEFIVRRLQTKWNLNFRQTVKQILGS